MKWFQAIVTCLALQFALSISTECPSNCLCHYKGTEAGLHCREFPEKFVPNVANLTLTHVNSTEPDISLLDKNYCDTLQHLNMSNLGINKINHSDAEFRLPNLKTLLLASNEFRHLSAETFEWCEDIDELAMNDNGLRNIDENTFLNLKNLRYLNLANNNLVNLNNIDLPQSLVSLDICNNQLEQIPVLKRNLPNLEMLSFSGNEYNTVTSGAFLRLPKLSLLGLGDTVTSVEEGSLSVLSNLSTLKLTGKGFLDSVSRKEIQTLPGLETLDLSFFTFPTITKDAMRGFRSLQILRLIDINSTSGFEDGVFETLTNLSLLDLSRSKVLVESLLLGIQKGWTIPSLESLLIPETNISFVSTEVLSLAPNLKFMDVSNNPLVCDSKWKDILHSSFVGELKFLNLPETVCTEPINLYGKQLLDASVLHEITKGFAVDENENFTSSTTMSPTPSGGIYYYLDLWGITTDDLLYTILALAIVVVILLIVVLIVACCKSRKSRCYCNSTKEGSAESFMMRANSEYTFDNFTLSETMAECQRGTLTRNGKLSTKS